jgi:hypothetical protein
MKNRGFILLCLLLTALIVYLFATAPAPLPENRTAAASIDIERVFRLAESENDAVRALWTEEIVGAGPKVGLQFSEDWRDEGEEAGPLPALFLRETARSLEKQPIRLSLFLGSDAPINSSNRFQGPQQEAFAAMRATGEPQFFRMPDTGLYTAMFPDEAVAEACVTCHNEHEDSPRNDWRLGDLMGATTWAYPQEKVTLDELVGVLAALRSAFREVYQSYLDKVATFRDPPEIGTRWPRDGYYLPSVEVFMAELEARAAGDSLTALLEAAAAPPPAPSVGP